MMTDYKLSPATSEEAETLNDKINAFVAQQVSFHGDAEVLKDYVIKKNGLIIAGIRTCFYLGECLAINVLFVDGKYDLNDPDCGEATVWLCKKTLPMGVQT